MGERFAPFGAPAKGAISMALMKDGLAAAAAADILGERHGAPLRSGATLPLSLIHISEPTRPY